MATMKKIGLFNNSKCHIVNWCPLTEHKGGPQSAHDADDDAMIEKLATMSLLKRN